jgi:hypothetical protein
MAWSFFLKDGAPVARGKVGWWLKINRKTDLKIKRTVARRRDPRPADFRETFAD